MPVVVFDHEELVDRLVRVVNERTGRMVRSLRVDIQDGHVVLWGLSPSYYYKQLATHAAMEELVGQSVANEIQVV
jgi:hypothetical protein